MVDGINDKKISAVIETWPVGGDPAKESVIINFTIFLPPWYSKKYMIFSN